MDKDDQEEKRVTTYTERIKIMIAERKAEEERRRREEQRLKDEAERRAFEKTFDYFKLQMRKKEQLRNFLQHEDYHAEEVRRQDYATYMQRVNVFNTKQKYMEEVKKTLKLDKARGNLSEVKFHYMKTPPARRESPEPTPQEEEGSEEDASRESPARRGPDFASNLYDKYKSAAKAPERIRDQKHALTPDIRISKKKYIPLVRPSTRQKQLSIPAMKASQPPGGLRGSPIKRPLNLTFETAKSCATVKVKRPMHSPPPRPRQACSIHTFTDAKFHQSVLKHDIARVRIDVNPSAPAGLKPVEFQLNSLSRHMLAARSRLYSTKRAIHIII